METQASHSSKYYSDIILGYHSYFRVILTMVIVKIHKNSSPSFLSPFVSYTRLLVSRINVSPISFPFVLKK